MASPVCWEFHSLTTIEHYPDVIAQSALTTLLNRIRLTGSTMSSTRFQVQCQPTLLVRGSTGPVRTHGLAISSKD